jgi:uncharacterized protein YegL
MSKDTTEIHVILDRSGSMYGVVTDIIGGYNKFLAEQKAEKGKATLSLVQFDDKYEVVHEAEPLSKVPDLNAGTYVPRGTTALMDAIGRTVSDTSAKYKKTAKAKRPGKVLFLIMTDGLENASIEFSKAKVMDMLKTHEKEHGWKFVFIGASLDSLAEAGQMGMHKGNMLRSNLATGQGVGAAYAAVSSSTSAYRGASLHSAKSADFFPDKDKDNKDA